MVDPICRSWVRFTPRFKTVLFAMCSSLILVTMTLVGFWIVSSTCIFTPKINSLVLQSWSSVRLPSLQSLVHLQYRNLSYERFTFSLLSAMWIPANSHCREKQQSELAPRNYDIRSTQVYHIAPIVQSNTSFKCRKEVTVVSLVWLWIALDSSLVLKSFDATLYVFICWFFSLFPIVSSRWRRGDWWGNGGWVLHAPAGCWTFLVAAYWLHHHGSLLIWCFLGK